MLTSKQPLLVVLITLVLAGLGGIASAQDKNKIVAERQDAMKQQVRDLVAVRNWFQDKGEQAAAVTGVEAAQKSVAKVPEWFPPGTGIGETSEKTRAKPEIWQQHDKFVADDKAVLGQLAQLEAAVKSGDKAKTEAVFGEIKFCESCHSTFRAKAEQ